jgi:hypothetical protein
MDDTYIQIIIKADGQVLLSPQEALTHQPDNKAKGQY